LAAITLAVYWPVTKYEFVNYDDTDFIANNPIIKAGLTKAGLAYAWQAEVARNWHPLTVLSHMLDCQLYGSDQSDAGKHHLTSLLLHTANTLLLFLLLRRLTGAMWRSALVAAMFAWHPLHVESVAWVAERKDVLSTFFWWLTLWAWIAYAADPRSRKSKLFYGVAVALYALAAMSKPMVVTLPFTLLLLDYWPLRRLKWQSRPGSVPSPPVAKIKQRPAKPPAQPADNSVPFWRLIVEKIPFFAVSLALCAETFHIQKTGGAMLDTLNLPIAARVSNSIASYVRYPAKMVWPENLAALYIRHGDWPIGEAVGALVLLVAVTILVLREQRARPYLAMGWFWYLGTLVPVIGLVQVGMQTMADRYTYVPMTGLFIILAWGGAELAEKFRLPKYIPAVATGVALLACVVLTARQITWWKDSETLFQRMVAVTDRNFMAHFNLGNLYSKEGKKDLAIQHYAEAVAEEPIYADAENNLAGLLLDEQHFDDAIQHFQHAAQLKPSSTAFFNLGNTLADTYRARHDTNDFAQSVAAYQRSLLFDPDSYATHNNFGMILQDGNQMALAITEFEAAVRAKPDFELGHFNLANALNRANRLDEAITHYHAAAALKPDRIETFSNAGVCYAREGKMEDAAREFRRAVELNPRDSAGWGNLGNALGLQNKLDEAVSSYQKALALDPADYQSEFNLGFSLLQLNRRDEARTHFQAALRIHPGYPAAQQALSDLDQTGK
jgi:tetratricopeptide (TPR) repeat protein